jgi:serine/threonine protein kinase
MIAEMEEQLAGTSIQERYEIRSLIARGGSGEIYSAWDRNLKRPVAIKRLRTAGMDPGLLGPLVEEATRTAALRHPNVVSVFDLGLDDGTPYIVMELIQGETLEVRAKRSVLKLEEFLELAKQSLDGLVAAHHLKLVHRDIKPGNLMLSPLPSGGFQVKILDFGTSKFVETPVQQTMDIEGKISGSIYWISPEQLNQEPVDGRSDIYALGCSFYYALTGRHPFDGEKVADVITAHLTHRVIPLAACRTFPSLAA